MTKRNIFISGASRGIGKSMAIHFANNNFNVVGTSRNNFNFDDESENLLPIKLDVTYIFAFKDLRMHSLVCLLICFGNKHASECSR